MRHMAFFFLLVLMLISTNKCSAGNANISKAELTEDIRQLVEFIEAVHPDPYVNGGGKIAFHRLYQDILASIPEQGLNSKEFYLLIRPLVASVGDSHTWLRDPFRTNFSSPGGIPLYFGVIETSLYVKAVAENEHKHLIGYRLVSVEGIDFKEIVNRQNKIMGADNEYLLLRNLAGTGVLYQKSFLEALLPEWKDKSQIAVELKSPGGKTNKYILKIPSKVTYPLISKGSRYKGPSTEKCDLAYSFIDDHKQTAVLNITGMNAYREAFEMWNHWGQDILEDAQDAYKRFHGSKPPKDLHSVIEGLPAATEIFKELVIKMREAKTKNLIIDLRRNEGGNSAMYNILIYFLYGKNKLIDIKMNRYEIEKYSSYYFEANPAIKLEDMNSGRKVKLSENDYNFNCMASGKEPTIGEFEDLIRQMPTFRREIESEMYDHYYCPNHVYVVSSENTFSSGYTLMYYLYRAGAKLVGTPSSQAGNCFGDVLHFQLKHSKLTGNVSHKKFVYFPDDQDRGRVLTPHYLLRYEHLAEYDFDPNAEMLYAIDLAAQEQKKHTVN